MKVTPLEIRQQQFPLRFRGLDPAEVDKFLELVASDMEDLIRENARLRDGLAKKDQELQRMQQGEDEIRKALATIQQIREDWLGRAEKQAEQVLMESELKAKQLQIEAERRLESLQHDLQELTRQKHQLVADIRHIIEEHLSVLETMGAENGESEELQRPLLETSESPQRLERDRPEANTRDEEREDDHGCHGRIRQWHRSADRSAAACQARKSTSIVTTTRQLRRRSRRLAVRGAPAIGVTAALGLAVGARAIEAEDFEQFWSAFTEICAVMAATRPTAVNLFWAIERMKACAQAQRQFPIADVKARLEQEARCILDEDIANNRRMGLHGQVLIADHARILTHCNAGALATAGYGTALGVIRAAVEQGKHVQVIADETRPVLQGARLTAWELHKDGIPVTLIADNMAASLMQRGMIDLVIVGADRIAANGDVANKIGTYGVAVLAHAHGIPFYVAAPLSTIDELPPLGRSHPHRGAAARRSHPPRRPSDRPDGDQCAQSGVRCDPACVCAGHHHRGGCAPPALRPEHRPGAQRHDPADICLSGSSSINPGARGSTAMLLVGRTPYPLYDGQEAAWEIGSKKCPWELSSIGPRNDSAPVRHLYYEGQRWSFADLKAETDRVAKGLLALGIQPGEKVCLWMPNRPEWISSMFAVMKIGAILVPINTRFRTADLEYVVRQSNSTTLITVDRSGPVRYVDMVGELCPISIRATPIT